MFYMYTLQHLMEKKKELKNLKTSIIAENYVLIRERFGSWYSQWFCDQGEASIVDTNGGLLGEEKLVGK